MNRRLLDSEGTTLFIKLLVKSYEQIKKREKFGWFRGREKGDYKRKDGLRQIPQ